MKIIHRTYKWAHPLVHRNGHPPYIIWHHAAAKRCGPATVHRWHLARGFSGIGYHLVVRKNGKVYRGRPLWAMGAHALGANDSVGVLAEGNYDSEKTMPAKQLRALQELHDYLEKRYPDAKHIGHRDVRGATTACPGRFYPIKAVRAGVPEKEHTIALTGQSLTVPRVKGVKAGWCTAGFKPWLKRIESEHPKRATIGPDSIIIPVPEKLPWWWDEMLTWRKSRRVVIRPRKRVPFWRRKR